MATKSHPNSKRMYSWWWDSHISPKNSKWLQENLTDMDSKVKQMIKLLEEDADSFARRAEMYYKKRPELMKLVEEFYRAYRALAERYDHATGALRQAQRTMSEAFPNQISFSLSDDSPASSATDSDPRTPEMPPPIRALFDPDELQKDALGLSSSHVITGKRNGAFTDDSDSLTSRKGLKHFESGEAINQSKFADGRIKKGLNFQDLEVKEQDRQNNGSRDLKNSVTSDSERVDRAEAEIVSLKKALAKLEAEKEASLLQYQQSLERLSNLELEVSRAQEDSQKLEERSNKAEAEVLTLKEYLTKLEAERENSLLQYRQCLDKISILEINILNVQKDAEELTERASKAETEAEILKQDLSRVETEKEAGLVKYQQCLAMISNLEGKILHAEEEARGYNERAEKAESELVNLKQAIAKLTEENEAAALRYQQCMEKIASLEHIISSSQEEAERLHTEIDNGVAKLKDAEERCLLLERSNQTLQSELESMLLKMASQTQEITDRQHELGKLQTFIQEEHLRYVEAETAFQMLQQLHSQSEEELRSLAAELQNRAQVSKDMEIQNQGLENEVQRVMVESKRLNELNLSSALSIKSLQDEISSLNETIAKVEAELELRVNERNALQQEFYCLKEEINDSNKKNAALLKQVESVGLNAEYFGSSVKELQDENSNLKKMCEVERSEKDALSEKLSVMKELLEKNVFLENSISDMNVELEELREKVKSLEGSCHTLSGEKAILVSEQITLMSRLHSTVEDLGKLSEKSILLENSLSDANDELEGLRVKSKCLDELCLLLDKEKSGLIAERDKLICQLEISEKKLENLIEKCRELEETKLGLVKERENALGEVEELQAFLDDERQKHANIVQSIETHLALMEEAQATIILKLSEEKDCLAKEVGCLQEANQKLEVELGNLHKKVEQIKTEVQSWEIQDDVLFGKLQISSVREAFFEGKIHELTEDKDCLTKETVCLQEANQKLEVELINLHKNVEQIKTEAQSRETQADVLFGELQISSVREAFFEGKINELTEDKDCLAKETVWLQEANQKLEVELINFHKQVEQIKAEVQSWETQADVLFCKLQISSVREVFFEGKIHEFTEDNHCLAKETACLQEANQKSEVELGNLHKQVGQIKTEVQLWETRAAVLFGELQISSVREAFFEGKIHELTEEKEGLAKEIGCLHKANKKLEVELGDLHERVEQNKTEVQSWETQAATLFGELHVSSVREAFFEGRVHELTEDNNCLAKEIQCLQEANEKFEVELGSFHEQVEQNKTEALLWENQAAVLFGELQISSVREAFFEGKIDELIEALKDLEDRSNSKDKEIEMLKDNSSKLQGENGGLRNQLFSYIPAIISLKDSINSLEEHTLLRNSQEDNKKGEMDSNLVTSQHPENCGDLCDDQITTDAYVELQSLQKRINAIEMEMVEMERLSTLEKSNANAKLESLMGEIEEVKSGSSKSKHTIMPLQGQKDLVGGLQNPNSEISVASNEVLTKDIVLDQISEGSSYAISRRDTVEADDHMLELWESTDLDSSIDLTAGKTQKVGTDLADHRYSKRPSNESLVEKELGVDKLEISKRFSKHDHKGNKKKILEGLDSDAQKLTNLQTTVRDFKRKMDGIEQKKKGKVTEHDNVKGQLEEAEETITKLFEVHRRLMKNVEDSSSMESNENGHIRSRRVLVQARRVSEKIGRLQLEVERVQFLLLKLDGEKQSMEKTKIIDRKHRVLLRDYLYGGVRTNQQSKKSTFCACLQPPTKGD